VAAVTVLRTGGGGGELVLTISYYLPEFTTDDCAKPLRNIVLFALVPFLNKLRLFGIVSGF
jgi:hypothetical protein